MENNQNIKKWNKESIYSISALVLAFLSNSGLANLLDKINYSSATIFRFDTMIFNISGKNWWKASLDLSYWIPIILGLIFLVLALFWGIKSIKKTSDGLERERMLGIISTTITSFIWILIIIFTIFPLDM